jgi:hypothetical protein
MAKQLAEDEYEKFNTTRLKSDNELGDFDQVIKKIDAKKQKTKS